MTNKKSKKPDSAKQEQKARTVSFEKMMGDFMSIKPKPAKVAKKKKQ